jgi:propanol-preferring alcohol dehydrogenase
MKAWRFTKAHEPLTLIERDDPTPGPGEVVVDVRAAGLCHSDVGFLDGVIAPARMPLILGHETAGEISFVGPDVTDFAVGDRVVLSGPEDFAAGWSADGGYATRCLAKAVGLVRLPDSVSYVQGATATDAGSTSYGAVMVSGRLRPGQRVGIVGLGGLGMTGARLAVINGAEVFAAEPRREVWDTAKHNGVTDVVEDVLELARHRLDLIVDFAGFGTTTAGAIVAVRPGGLVVQVGLGRDEATISTALLTTKAVTLRGSRGGLPGTVDAVLQHIAAGELTIEASTLTFDEIPAGLDRLRHGGVIGRLVALLDEEGVSR